MISGVASGSAAAALRAALVGVAAVGVAWPVQRCLSGAPALRRSLCASLLLAFLIPPVLPVYAYAPYVVGLVRHPWLRELAYAAYLTARAMPLVVAALMLVPPAVTREAAYCRALAAGGGARGALASAGCVLAGDAFRVCAAWSAAWILCFHDFDAASLWAVPSWTVALFDAHAGGLALSRSVVRALPPALLSVALAVVLLVSIRRQPRGITAEVPQYVACAAWERCLGVVFSVGCLVFLVGAPLWMVAHDGVDGIAPLVRNVAYAGDLSASMLLAATAALGAYGVGSVCTRMPAALLLVPGMLGPLQVGLALIALVGCSWLSWARATPFPLCAGLVLLLAPYAAAMHMARRALRPAEAVHVALCCGDSGQSPAVRRGVLIACMLRHASAIPALCALFAIAYGDIMLSSLLAPPGLTPVFVRVHNFAHYGRPQTLAAMVALSAALPAVLLAAAAFVTPAAFRRASLLGCACPSSQVTAAGGGRITPR